jgi:hypothetical protein
VRADVEAIALLSEGSALAFVNSHFAGFAPETVRQLAALVGA